MRQGEINEVVLCLMQINIGLFASEYSIEGRSSSSVLLIRNIISVISHEYKYPIGCR